MNELISIIVPVYNVEEYLERCVNSLTQQTYRNIEILLINDGSTDSSGVMCDRLAKSDKRIRTIHKDNGGQAEARNDGISASTGDYVLFVDSDDYLDIYACEELISIAVNRKVDLVSFRERKVNCKTGDRLYTNEDENRTVVTLSGHEAGRRYLYGEYIQHAPWCKLYRKKVLDTIRFPVGRLAEDYATTYLYVAQCSTVAYYDRILYNYSIRPDSTMGQRSMKLTLDVYKTACEFYQFEKKNYPDEQIILEKGYCNCLLKTIARIYNEKASNLIETQIEVEEKLKQIQFSLLPLSSKIIYLCYQIMPRNIFGVFMKIIRKNG